MSTKHASSCPGICLCPCAKFGWNGCSCFDNMQVAIFFCTLGLKMPIHDPKIGGFGVKVGEMEEMETFCSFIPQGMQYPETDAP